MSTPDKDTLLKLYELAVSEEHFFCEAHHKGVALYSGIVMALAAGTVAGVIQASTWYHFALLCIGPVLIFSVSAIAMKSTKGLYRRYLEAITMRAKIEQQLGLTEPLNTNAGSYWPGEPAVATRHLGDRRRYDTSEEFIQAGLRKGFFWTICFFTLFKGVGVLIFLGLVSIVVSKALCS